MYWPVQQLRSRVCGLMVVLAMASGLSVARGQASAPASAPTSAPATPALRVTPDHADGVYQVGETVRWTILAEAGVESVNYTLKTGGQVESAKGTLTIKDGKAELESKFEKPGALLLKLSGKAADEKKITAIGGAVAAVDQVKRSVARPDDFDAFWAEKVKELQAVPTEAVLTPVEVQAPNVTYAKITMNNIRGTKIQGQIARPSGEGKRPALLVVQWAGVYPLDRAWAVDRAKEGWLVLNIIAHDLPIDESKDFYKAQGDGPLKDYPVIGNDDRETSYFLRMYLSCYRAADYLTEQPDWDGKTLIVTGGSQGGMQALMTAGLHPKVTGATASVPAGCDLTGPEAGRAAGWPQWYHRVEGKDAKKVRSAAQYFDVMNFAPNIKCPVLVGVGTIDETCPPEGIFAMFNEVTSPKRLVILPGGAHNGPGNTHAPYGKAVGAWLTAFREGKPVPLTP